MPFQPDIVVTEADDSCRVLLILEAKRTKAEQSSQQLRRYMWETSCPIGLLVTPQEINLYRNHFTGYSDDSVQHVGAFPAPASWRVFERQKSERDFLAAVQHWLELTQVSLRFTDVPLSTKSMLAEHVVPILISGRIHAAGPRIPI